MTSEEWTLAVTVFFSGLAAGLAWHCLTCKATIYDDE